MRLTLRAHSDIRGAEFAFRFAIVRAEGAHDLAASLAFANVCAIRPGRELASRYGERVRARRARSHIEHGLRFTWELVHEL